MPSRPPKPGGKYSTDDQTRIGELHSISGEKPQGKVFLLTFHCFGKNVGELELKGKNLHFKGDAAKSAKLLFDRLKTFVEQYIVERLESGPRTHTFSITLSDLKRAQNITEPNISLFLRDFEHSVAVSYTNWFQQAREPGDKFIVEITK